MTHDDHRRFHQADLVLDEIRDHVLDLLACATANERLECANTIIDDLGEIEHLLAIRQTDSGTHRVIAG